MRLPSPMHPAQWVRSPDAVTNQKVAHTTQPTQGAIYSRLCLERCALLHVTDQHPADVEVHATSAHQMMMMGDDADGIFIISGKPLDASTQASIRAVLQSAGHDTEV